MNIVTQRKFYLLNGPANRLRHKGIPVHFSYEKWAVGGWRCAVCSDEVSDAEAATLALAAGKLGLSEITEAEFLKITGRKPSQLPAPKIRAIAPPAAAQPGISHPSVFVMLGRYGDICNVLPMLKAEADAGRRPTLVVSQDFADILDGVTYCDRIVWEGAYDRLPEALRWLKVSKGIPAPVICQCFKHPWDKARLCDSYQKEVWRVAGRLAEFDARGPLVFDRRDHVREHKLLDRSLYGKHTGTILVGLQSYSSPLENAPALMEAIRARFSETHNIVDLTTIKAERIYDLIALYEAASCLVVSDTVHIHLSRATHVPVVALINSGWRGSVVHEGVTAIRYENATPEAVVSAAEQVLQHSALAERYANAMAKHTGKNDPQTRADRIAAVEVVAASRRDGMTYAGIHRIVEASLSRIFHVVDVFGCDARHHLAQSTWTAAYAEGIVPVHVRDYPRDAKTELRDRRALPFFKDVLKAGLDASSNPADIIVWTNGDIGLRPGTAAALRQHVGQHGAACMRRTETNGEHHVGRDLFAFTREWLVAHWDEMPDYVQGAPVFDLGLVAMIRRHHGLPTGMKNLGKDMPPADMPPGFAIHHSHKSEWETENWHLEPSAMHNRDLFHAWAKKRAPEVKFNKWKQLQ